MNDNMIDYYINDYMKTRPMCRKIFKYIRILINFYEISNILEFILYDLFIDGFMVTVFTIIDNLYPISSIWRLKEE